jgi:hypothetical protein
VIIVWILTLFAGSSAFVFAYIYLQYDILSSLRSWAPPRSTTGAS